MPKVSIIGSGNVGGFCAARVAEAGIAQVVLLDIEKDICKAKALDIQDSLSFRGIRHQIKATNNYKDIKHSDIIVITAGFARRPGMTRDDLLAKNGLIVKDIAKKIKFYSPKAIVIMVTNPVDVLTYIALKVTKISPNRILGMGTSLDNARFKSLIVGELNISASSIDSMIIGQHGNSMVILPRFTRIESEPAIKVLGKKRLKSLIERTKNRGKQIVSLFRSGSAYFAPSAAINEIIHSILLNENKVIPVSVYLRGMYGLNDICIGMPVRLGSCGIKEIIKLALNKKELREFKESAKEVKSNINRIKKIFKI